MVGCSRKGWKSWCRRFNPVPAHHCFPPGLQRFRSHKPLPLPSSRPGDSAGTRTETLRTGCVRELDDRCHRRLRLVEDLLLLDHDDRTFTGGYVGPWTKADSVTEFAELQIIGTPAM